MSEQDTIIEAQQMLRMAEGKLSHPAIEKALKLMECAVISAPFDAKARFGLAEAQIFAGNVCKGKVSIVESIKLGLCSVYSNVSQGPSEKWPPIRMKPFSDLSPQKYETCMNCLDRSYRGLIELGLGDARLRFYLANFCKIRKDFDGFSFWLNHEDINDGFYSRYSISSGSDAFILDERCWVQQKFFQRIAEMSPSDANEDLYPEYYRCLSCEFEHKISTISPCSSDSDRESCGNQSEEESDKSEECDNLDGPEWLSSQLEHAQFFQGYFLREVGDIHSALDCFEVAEKLCAEKTGDPILSAVLLGKARVHFELLNIEEARNLYHRAVQAAMNKRGNERFSLPASFQPSSVLADSFAGLSACDRLLLRPKEAESWAIQALESDEACCDAIIQLLHIYLDQRKHTLFQEKLEKLTDTKGVGHNGSFKLTTMALHHKIQHAAIQKGDRMIDKINGPERANEKSWVFVFTVLIRPGIARMQIDAVALAVYQLHECPFPWGTGEDEVKTLLAKGKWFLKRLGMVAESMSAYTCALRRVHMGQSRDCSIAAIKCFWKRHKLFLMTGNAKQALDDLSVSLEELEKISCWPKSSQKKAKIHLAYGLIMLKLEDLPSAQQSFMAAIESNPGLTCAKGYLGLIYSQMDSTHHHRAIDLLKQYLEPMKHSESNPDRTIMLTYAKLLCSTSKTDAELIEAMNICSRVLEQDAKDMDALFERAGSHMLLRRWEAAIADYTCIITSQKSPGRFISAYYHRGRAHQQMQQYDRALKDFQRAEEGGFDGIHLCQNLAFCYEALGNLQTALKWHDNVLSRNDSDVKDCVVSLTRKVALNAVMKQDGLAVKDLDSLLKLFPSSIDFLFQRACLLTKRWNDTAPCTDTACLVALRRALDDLDTVLTADPGHLQARLKRAQVHEAVYGDMPDDAIILEMTMAVEEKLFSKADPYFLCYYAVSLSEEILSNESGKRIFSFIVKNKVGGSRIDLQVDSSGRLLSRDPEAMPDGPFNVPLGLLHNCRLERRRDGPPMFAFNFRCESANYHLAAEKLSVREKFFLMSQVFSDGGVVNSSPISIFNFVREAEPNNLMSLYYPALLHDRNGENEEAKLWYMATLQALHDADEKGIGMQSCPAVSDGVESQGVYTENQAAGISLFQPIAGRYLANNLRSEICFRLGLLQLDKDSGAVQGGQRMEAAGRLFEFSVRNNEQNSKGLEFLGYLALKSQRFEDAGRWYEALAKINPQSAEAQNNLGVVKEMKGDFSAALSLYSKANGIEQANVQYMCNMCMIRIRSDESCASDVVDRMTQVIDATKHDARTRYFPFLVRAIAFHIRNGARGEVHDKDLAVRDYEHVLSIEPRCFQARVMLAHAAVTAGDVFRASEHIQWLDLYEPRSQVLAELKFLAFKIELMYSSVLADFVFAVKINPKFYNIDLNLPNVDVRPLKLSLESLLLVKDKFDSSGADSKIINTINAIEAAFCLNNMAKVVEETTKLATMCKQNHFLLARTMACRALAHAQVGRSRSASQDALNALNCLGIYPNLDKPAIGENQCDQLSDPTRVSLAYSLFCLLGSTYETCFHAAQNDSCAFGNTKSERTSTDSQDAFERAQRCYHRAAELMPERVEAFLNTANLCRKVKCYDECLVGYLQVLRCLARDEHSVGSPLADEQQSLLDVMSEYYAKWKDVMESTVFSSKGIYKAHTLKDIDRLQGEMLWLSKKLFGLFRRSQRGGTSTSLQAARKNLLKVTSSSIKLVCGRPGIFHEAEDVARTIYNGYLKSLDDLVDASNFAIGDMSDSQQWCSEEEMQSLAFPLGELEEMLRGQSPSEEVSFRKVALSAMGPLADIMMPPTISQIMDKSERESLLLSL